MHRFLLLLFILGLGHCIYAASIFQFPDLTRRLPERTTSPGCAYKGERYEHGERVPTPEPCLNCTCIRAVLVCYLRVCPTASAPPAGCFAAREVGECCPTLVCGGADLSRPTNKSDSNLDLRPTFQPERDETTLSDVSSEESYTTDTFITTHNTSLDPSQSVYSAKPDISTKDDSFSETTLAFETSSPNVFSTVGDGTFGTTLSSDDSLVYITSTQEPTHDYDMNFFNDIPGGCMVNGTLYGDGSAMLSSTFCEYCFCIRGKSTCLKPKCHLVIDGCTPHYDNHYSCCPSRYECLHKTSSSESKESTEIATVTSSTYSETTEYLDPSDCRVDGKVYHQGDVVPDRLRCHNCYCSDSSVKCEKIKCSPPLEGCQPIIPEGHCCPVSYRCDYQSGQLPSNSIKGVNLTNSAPSSDTKGSDIKSVKNYFASSDGETRVKTPNDQESFALLHNVIPVHRRLDENVVQERNSTLKDVDEVAVHVASTKVYDDSKIITDHVRENDKTLNLEHNDTSDDISYSAEERTFEDIEFPDRVFKPEDESYSTELVSVGLPELHTLSIQELFDQFFLKHQINSSKISDNAALEPKRNNSKQPVSIVEINDSELTIPSSTEINTTPTEFTPIPEIKEIVNTETDDSRTNLFVSSYEPPMNATSSTADYTSVQETFAFDNANVNQNASSFDQKQTLSETTSLEISTTENYSNEDLYSRTDTEPTYAVFLSSTKENYANSQDEITTFSTTPSFTTKDDLSSQDPLETSSSETYTTISDLLSLKFRTIPPTHPTFPYVNTRVLHTGLPKQTHFTPPIYTTTKNPLIQGLNIQTEARPVVFIYDTTRNVFNEPKTHPQTQPTPLIYGTSKTPFNDEPKQYTKPNSESLWFKTTKDILTNAEKQTNIPSTYFTPEILLSELKKQSELPSISQGNIDTTKFHDQVQTETPSISAHFITTSGLKNDDQEKTQEPLFFISTTKNINNELEIKTESSPISNTNIYENDSKLITESELPDAISTLMSTKNANGDYSIAQTDSRTSPPIFTTTKNTDSEDKSAAEIQVSPVFISEDNQNDKKFQDQSNPTIEILASNTNNEHNLNKEDIAETPLTEKQDHPTTASFLLDGTNDDSSGEKKTVTTVSSKLPNRINSKLPSFSYIEKGNQNETIVYPRIPITDSVVNVYLPTDVRNSNSSERDDFGNIGSIYIGAPLSVGGSDSPKDLSNEKPKITHSGGVIFMDPKYTDIDTPTNFENHQTEMQLSPDKLDKDVGNHERKKGPRIQDSYNQPSAGPGYKIIPFVAEDAVRGQFGKLNASQILTQSGSTEGVPDMVSDFCFIKGRIYINGEMIGKSDPCELCRCFYGRELCQIQRCPTPPDCVPEKVPGFCCPRFTCGNNATTGEQIKSEIKPVSHLHVSEDLNSTTRKPDIIDRHHLPNDKQEVKFGIRVRARPTTSLPLKLTEHWTDKKMQEKTSTVKQEMRTLTNKPTIATTTSRKPQVVRTTANKHPEEKTTTTTTTTTTTSTTQSPLFPDPWGLLKVSGCNIYGKFFNINDQVEILSGPCSHCICTTNGVECNDIC